ncbi:MOSC domain-containing protein [Aeromicrobium sp. CnD17-E]|uniref:MOSC domain-containing protein n=1 Tax=Aeromicrobium sp. CnD17-E TaxID=2954487 RepID=UPI0020978B3E|nr:MOSC N-terminal beta barrel domain-containing protein [Aeromicrobium sp. CnD17-E]MCO7240656.1 MOSC N-terminal beta barrel domain-containing protein [Aeromicrobium sp. CnD17-E]
MQPTVASLWRYPVKSCRGESLARVEVEPWGLAQDRRWMVVDPAGGMVTARELNRLLVVHATLTDDGLRLTVPGAAAVDVPLPDPTAQVPISIWSSRLTAADAGDGAATWLGEVLGRQVRLVHLDDPRRRPTSPTYSEPDDRVSLADGYPLLLTTRASAEAVSAAAGTPVPMHRYRPNLVVEGTEPWGEDTWRRFRIGDVTFRVVKGCARCVMTTMEPDHDAGTVARGPEPTRTLAQLRRFGKGVWFGVNVIPDRPLPTGATIALGDPVEVLEAAEPGMPPIGS